MSEDNSQPYHLGALQFADSQTDPADCVASNQLHDLRVRRRLAIHFDRRQLDVLHKHRHDVDSEVAKWQLDSTAGKWEEDNRASKHFIQHKSS